MNMFFNSLLEKKRKLKIEKENNLLLLLLNTPYNYSDRYLTMYCIRFYKNNIEKS